LAVRQLESFLEGAGLMAKMGLLPLEVCVWRVGGCGLGKPEGGGGGGGALERKKVTDKEGRMGGGVEVGGPVYG
jgi:hypothetical protein